MAGNGPAREAFEIAALKGHPSNRSQGRADAPKTAVAPPSWTPPGHLSSHAKAEWKRLVTPLVRIGLLTIADRDVFATYCTLHGRHVEAEYMIAREGVIHTTPNGHKQPSPWVTISRDAATLKLRYLAELGLTPASRTKVQAGTPPSKEEEEPPTSSGAAKEEPFNAPNVTSLIGKFKPPA